MGQKTKIQWTDHTFNPWIGCQKVSAGCRNCYAKAFMTRKDRWSRSWGPPETSERLRTSEDYWKQPARWNKQAKAAGRRERVLCGSLMDIFEDNHQVADWRFDLWQLIEQTPLLDWLLLTKRPENILEMDMAPWTWHRKFNVHDIESRSWLDGKPGFTPQPENWPNNVWTGASVENQDTADRRIPKLIEVPGKHFLSIEPLLGPVDLSLSLLPYCGSIKRHIQWIIVGGESGPNYRPMKKDWALSLRDQSVAEDIPFFFKQWGGTKKINDAWGGNTLNGWHWQEMPEEIR